MYKTAATTVTFLINDSLCHDLVTQENTTDCLA